jgi:hypothetical protein
MAMLTASKVILSPRHFHAGRLFQMHTLFLNSQNFSQPLKRDHPLLCPSQEMDVNFSPLEDRRKRSFEGNDLERMFNLPRAISEYIQRINVEGFCWCRLGSTVAFVDLSMVIVTHTRPSVASWA